jgi:hypothetical protein
MKFKGGLPVKKQAESSLVYRNFLAQLLQISLTGSYEHCNVAANFRTTMELNTIFGNADHPEIRTLLDTLLSSCAQKNEERWKYDKVLNNIFMEFVALQLQGNAAVNDAIFDIYATDLALKSLVLMDTVRIVLNHKHSLNLLDVFEVEKKLCLKYSRKLANRQCVGNIQAICNVILASDETRYDSVYRKRATLTVDYQMTAEQQWMIECFIQHLNPNRALYAEELKYVGLRDETIRALSRIEDLQKKRPEACNLAIAEFDRLDRHQASLAAYFFEYLNRYLRFQPILITNLDWLEKQEHALMKIAKLNTADNIPEALETGIASPCCDRWNVFFPTKSYMWKTIDDKTGKKEYHTTVGNQSLRADPVSGEILCGFVHSKPSKKKNPSHFRKLQRNLEIEAGLIPSDIDKEFITVRKEYLAAQRKSNSGEIPRLTKQRKLEGRIPDCARSRVLQMNLRNIVLHCPPLKIPKQKKKDAQKKLVEEKKAQDRNRLYPLTKATLLPVSKPPYFISPCCGRIHGYKLGNWSANGYFCGGCLPDSNNEKAIANELLCAACLGVIPNRPAFNRCSVEQCKAFKSKKKNKCKHGAQPVILYDDVYRNGLAFQFICDDCMSAWRHTPEETLRLSAIKAHTVEAVSSVSLSSALSLVFAQ